MNNLLRKAFFWYWFIAYVTLFIFTFLLCSKNIRYQPKTAYFLLQKVPPTGNMTVSVKRLISGFESSDIFSIVLKLNFLYAQFSLSTYNFHVISANESLSLNLWLSFGRSEDSMIRLTLMSSIILYIKYPLLLP